MKMPKVVVVDGRKGNVVDRREMRSEARIVLSD